MQITSSVFGRIGLFLLLLFCAIHWLSPPLADFLKTQVSQLPTFQAAAISSAALPFTIPEPFYAKVATFLLAMSLFMIFAGALEQKNAIPGILFPGNGSLQSFGSGILTQALILTTVLLVQVLVIHPNSILGVQMGALEVLSSLAYSTAFVILIAYADEVIFRGYLLNALSQSLPPFFACLASAVLYGGMKEILRHNLGSPLAMDGLLETSAMGLFFGIAAMHSKNIYFPLGLHLAHSVLTPHIFGRSAESFFIYGIAPERTIHFSFNVSQMLVIPALGLCYLLIRRRTA